MKSILFTAKKIPDRRPMSTETTRSAPDVIIVSKPIRWGWPSGPRPGAPTPPWYFPPQEARTCPEGQPCKSALDICDGYYSQYFNDGPIYDYCLNSDCKSKTLPRNFSSVDCKKNRSVCFYGVDDTPRKKTFVVRADIEPNR